jgi:5-methyltetrahydrofolate--homocysteine methyltransferase
LPWLILLRQRQWSYRLYGLFLCDHGFCVDEWAAEFEKDLDDYNSIMVKALADRLQKLCRILARTNSERNLGLCSEEQLSTSHD